MENASTMNRSSKIICTILTFALAVPGMLGAQALTAEEAYAASAKPKVKLTTPVTVQLKKGEKHKIRVKTSKGAKVAYKSSKKSVASVSKKGVVTAKKAGSATIRIKATKGKKSTIKNVRVKVVKASSRAAANEQVSTKTQELQTQPKVENYLIVTAPSDSSSNSGNRGKSNAAREDARTAVDSDTQEAPGIAIADNDTQETPGIAIADNDTQEAPGIAIADNDTQETPGIAIIDNAPYEDPEGVVVVNNTSEKVESTVVVNDTHEGSEGTVVEITRNDPASDVEEPVKIATHSFLFIPNGATDKAFTLKAEGNGVFALPACTFTREGYEFTGWNTKEDGSGASFAARASFSLPDASSLHVFYAQWKSIKRNGEYTENGKVYYYDADGNKATGWQNVNGAKRYYDPANGGARVGAGERHIGKQLLFNTSSNWYLFDANGTMLTGWQNVNGQTKFFRSDGTRAQGEVYIAKGELGTAVSGYRYFDSNGAIQLGWRTIGGDDKYFDLNNGVRASGVFTVPSDGGSGIYCFNANTGARMANVVQGDYYFRPGDGVGLRLANIPSGEYEIVSALGSKYLDVSAASSADGANVQIWDCTHTNAQVFSIQKASGSYYKIINVNSRKAVDVTGGDSRNGVNVQQYAWNGSDAQLWLPVECNGGMVFFNKATNKVLDVSSGICANGTNVQSWEFNDSQAQVWRLYKTVPYPDIDRFGMTKEERETADSVWNSYVSFRAQKGVPAVNRSDYCTQLAYNTAKACAQAGRMQHGIAIPQDKATCYSDILQYATWRKAGPEAIDRWDKSEGHHRMMRNDNGTTEAGVGVYFDGTKWWYVIVYNHSYKNNQYKGDLW